MVTGAPLNFRPETPVELVSYKGGMMMQAKGHVHQSQSLPSAGMSETGISRKSIPLL